MASNIEIIGVDSLNLALAGWLQQFTEGVQTSIEHAVDTCFDGSQQDCPVDTGELKDSGVKEVGHLEGSVTYGTDHCWYVELGTSKMAPQPYVMPNFTKAGQQLLDELKNV